MSCSPSKRFFKNISNWKYNFVKYSGSALMRGVGVSNVPAAERKPQRTFFIIFDFMEPSFVIIHSEKRSKLSSIFQSVAICSLISYIV